MHHVTLGHKQTTVLGQIDINTTTHVYEATAFSLAGTFTELDIATRFGMQPSPGHDHDNISTLVRLQPDTVGLVGIIRIVGWLQHLALNRTAGGEDAIGMHLHRHPDALA